MLDADPRTAWEPFTALAVAAVLYSIGTILAAPWIDRRGWSLAATAIVDLGLLFALTLVSGGPTSEVRRAYVALPLAAALVTRPGAVAAWTVAAFGAYLVTALPLADASETTASDVAAHALYVACAGTVGLLLSVALHRRRRDVLQLAEERGHLADRALEAGEAERKKLSYVLHDEAIQNLLAAQLELSRVPRGDLQAATRALTAVNETVECLRGTLRDLHPYLFDHAGLRAALQQQAERAANLARADVRLEVDDDACRRDDYLAFMIARELLDNAARHSEANNISVSLSRDDDHLLLEVRDDGLGIAVERPEVALREGHIGLAACGQRLRTRGGTLSIAGVAAGPGTSVTARWPTRDASEAPKA